MKQAKNIKNTYIIVLTARKMYNMFMHKMTLLKMIKYNHIGRATIDECIEFALNNIGL
jgi:hypothetical protein